ncbi:MAG: hypothetical protein AB1500_01865 [Bacillota bacterium]
MTIYMALSYGEGQDPGDPEQSGQGSLRIPMRVEIKTDKKYYLMDPYWWVYSASKDDLPGPGGNPHLWPEEGYNRTVNFTVYINDLGGNSAQVQEVVCRVVYNGGRLLKEGSVTAAEPGVFSGSFDLWETDFGGPAFTGWEPKELTIQALADGRVVKRQNIHVGRWGCDRCHLESGKARQIYPWVSPTGGYWGPHGWHGVLGGAGSVGTMFDITNLTNAEKTHAPNDILTGTYGHEYTVQKQCGNSACSPCHQGSGRLRYPWTNPPYYTHPGEKVDCTFCHGIEGGYLPSGVLDWSSVMRPGYFDNWAEGSKWKDNAGFSAIHGHCDNVHCHGRVNDSAEGDIDTAKPGCRDAGCHDNIP